MKLAVARKSLDNLTVLMIGFENLADIFKVS